MNEMNDEQMPVVSPENCRLYRKTHNAIDTEYWILNIGYWIYCLCALLLRSSFHTGRFRVQRSAMFLVGSLIIFYLVDIVSSIYRVS